MTIISLKNVSLTLSGNAGDVEVLHNISVEVETGQSIGLVGPSGSGKSSLLMLLGGLDRATKGEVQVLGHDLTRMDEDELAVFRREHMGIVFQSFHLIPTMTALENVATPLELAGATDALERAGVELELVGLKERLHHYPSQLSGGEQQRVALARAGVVRPDILLADEPTGNLDARTGQVIMDILFQMAERDGTTLVLVTHARELVARCTRVIELRDGRIAPVLHERAGE